MGGFFSAPSAPPPAPPPPPPDTGEEERQRRLDAIERRRRGRAGTIATSERGVFEERADTSAAATSASPLKDKLGE